MKKCQSRRTLETYDAPQPVLTPLNRRSIVSLGVSMASAAARRESCILRRAASSAWTRLMFLVSGRGDISAKRSKFVCRCNEKEGEVQIECCEQEVCVKMS
jgi:hypothetical protein